MQRIEIQADSEDQDLICKKIALAVEEKLKLLKTLGFTT
jgi:hypothetical protein